MSSALEGPTMTRALRRAVGAVVVGLVWLTALLAVPNVARAHTGFESSTPADGAALAEPVDVVVLTFTGDATPVADEIVALTAAGTLQQPIAVETTDNRVFTVRFDPPLAGGQIGIRWKVKAADAHPIDGAFSFTVADTTAPDTTAPDTSDASSTTAAPVVVEPVADTVAPTTTHTMTDAEMDAAGHEGMDAAEHEAMIELDEFLAVDASAPGRTLSTVGRLVGYPGIVLGIGALAFVATAMTGPRREVLGVVAVVRLLGLVTALGGLIEYVGVARVADDAVLSSWSSSHGFATVLRIVGGLALAFGLTRDVARVRAPQALSAAVLDDVAVGRIAPAAPVTVRWVARTAAIPALIAATLIVVSFWFDGHTVSEGFRPLHAALNTVHVLAGSIWAGGVAALCGVVTGRHRAGRPLGVAELVVRFSKVASIALAAVLVAGGLMAWVVLPSFSDLTATEWGQVLLLKSAAVGFAMLLGAHNHFRLRPALEAAPQDADVLDRVRATLIAETILLVFVVVVTVWLVTAATV